MHDDDLCDDLNVLTSALGVGRGRLRPKEVVCIMRLFVKRW